MTPKQFVTAMMDTVIDAGVDSYKQTLARPGVVSDPYWRRLLDLYRSVTPRQRRVIVEVVRQVQIDALSEVCGILDGTSALNGRSEQFELAVRRGRRRIKLNGDLQDFFLELAEKRERKTKRR